MNCRPCRTQRQVARAAADGARAPRVAVCNIRGLWPSQRISNAAANGLVGPPQTQPGNPVSGPGTSTAARDRSPSCATGPAGPDGLGERSMSPETQVDQGDSVCAARDIGTHDPARPPTSRQRTLSVGEVAARLELRLYLSRSQPARRFTTDVPSPFATGCPP
jgi:hypothetical protein